MVTILVEAPRSEAWLWFRVYSSQELIEWTRAYAEFTNESYLEPCTGNSAVADLYDTGQGLLFELYQQQNVHARRYVAKLIFEPGRFGLEMLGLPQWDKVLPEVRATMRRVMKASDATFVADKDKSHPQRIGWLSEILAKG